MKTLLIRMNLRVLSRTALVALLSATSGFSAEITVGSKSFTESYILGELAAQTLEKQSESPVQRKLGMGSSGVLFEALRKGAIDLYPEYTGTVAEALLKQPDLSSHEAINRALEPLGLVMSAPLGFNNTYALAVTEAFAQEHDLNRISDLVKVAPTLRAAFSYEFMDRKDGYAGMIRKYGLSFGPRVKRMEHSLAYEAIGQGSVDLIEVYSTDAKIEKFKLRVLEDDRAYFPTYLAVYLARRAFPDENPAGWKALNELAGTLDEPVMIDLNARAELQKQGFSRIASDFLGAESRSGGSDEIWARVARRTQEHLALVLATLLVSISLGIPLGVIATRAPLTGRFVLLASSVVQTIPALALLCFLIPLLGIGFRPALAALCLYGLLPIVLNTFVGIKSIDPRHHETARALGLTEWAILKKITLPLASPAILAGIKTSTIVSIGNATLAALIGAGGYGAPIVSGLALNDIPTILIGAIPAAALSLIVFALFGLVTRMVVPRGIRNP